MLEQITPIVLTYNEAANIARSLSALSWARQVIVVDSGSEDETLEICAAFANVCVLHRPFDSFAAQWRFALSSTALSTQWVLALDADYILPLELCDELATLQAAPADAAWIASFVYCINGRPLRASLYPPHIVLFRRQAVQVHQDGHAYRFEVDGTVHHLTHRIWHDDRKSQQRWRRNQYRYAQEEADKIRACTWRHSRLSDRLRRVPLLTTVVVPLYLMLVRGLLLDGPAGWRYVAQRCQAEWMIQWALVRSYLKRRSQPRA